MTIRRTRRRGKTSITLREQNKSAEAQAMLQTLPQSLRQKLQPRVVAGMPGDALRRQAWRRSAAVTQPAPLPPCAKASPAIRTIRLRLDPPGCCKIG